MKQKRKHPRIAFEVEAEIKKVSSKKVSIKKAILVKSRNISKEGIFVTSKRCYNVGTLLDLTLYLKTYATPIHLIAKVIWIAKKRLQPHLYPGMGTQIVEIAPGDRKRIGQYIVEKTRNYKDALELQQMYFSLKNIAARLVELEEKHPQASNFKNIMDKTIEEIDRVAHIIDKEIWEVRHL